MVHKITTIDEFKVFFLNQEEYLDIAKEIFETHEYQFSSQKIAPTIIDCGSHIGLATLYFKKLFPLAKITCVEPIPENFTLLQKNIEANHLQSITLINAAVADIKGKSVIFGEFRKENPRYCGSSLYEDWANPDSSSLVVETILLSSLLNDNVDFLKLDVEGAEGRVIREIEDKIHRVDEICIEFHGLNKNNQENNLDDIVEILRRNNFEIEIHHKIIENIFPEHLLN